ncbi:MAG: YciI family protein, partial [Bryobacteraceae bacterium]
CSGSAFAQPDPATMDKYVFTFIWSRADRRATTNEEGNRIQAAHMAHIESMAKDGPLVAAGPIVSKTPRLRGIFIFHSSLEQAKELAAADPTVKEGLLEMESHPWYSYKGIGEQYKTWRAANPDGQVKMATYQLAVLRNGPKFGTASAPDMQKWQMEHLANIAAAHRAGKLVLAGPMLDKSDIRGIGVLTVGADEAKALFANDPFVVNGMMTIDWYSWMAAEGSFPPPPAK